MLEEVLASHDESLPVEFVVKFEGDDSASVSAQVTVAAPHDVHVSASRHVRELRVRLVRGDDALEPASREA